MALALGFFLVVYGAVSVALLVQSVRQNRDDPESVAVRLGTPVEESEGDRAGTPRGDADGEAPSVSGYHFNLFV